MDKTPAVLLYRNDGVNWERQFRACIEYLEENGYEVVFFAANGADAAATIRDRKAKIVVTPIAAKGDEVLRSQVEEAGGALEYCRDVNPGLVDIDTDTLIVQVYRKAHASVHSIAEVLGETTGRVRQALGMAREESGRPGRQDRGGEGN